MNNKLIITILVGLFIFLFVMILYFVFFNKSSTIVPANNDATINIEPLGTQPIPKDEFIFVRNNSGVDDSIKVKNFYKTSKQIIATSVYLEDTKKYSIIYSQDDESFTLALYARDDIEAKNYRLEAETSLLNQLGIPEVDACNLIENTDIPPSYSEKLAGTDYGLSFCASGIDFPSVPASTNQPINIR